MNLDEELKFSHEMKWEFWWETEEKGFGGVEGKQGWHHECV